MGFVEVADEMLNQACDEIKEFKGALIIHSLNS